MKNNQSSTNFNSDIRIIRSLSAHKIPGEAIHARSVSQLAALLKVRKQQSKSEMIPQIDNGRKWLVQKGINLEAIVTRVAEVKKQVTIKKTKKEAQSYFHVNLNSEPLEEYLSKAQEYASMSIMQSIMSKPSHRRTAINRLVQSVVQQSRMLTTAQCEITLENKNSYIEIIKYIVRNEDKPVDISKRMLQQLKLKFMTVENNSLWQILDYQLSNYNHNDKLPANMTRMLISSLKLIQLEFYRRIHGKDFDRYVNHYYLSKVDPKYLEKKCSLWPKVWLAYCANQTNRVKDLLASDTRNHMELIKIYEQSEQYILKGKPFKQSFAPQYDIEDIFYQQFIYNITGQSRTSHDFFTDGTSLQFLLIVVSTLGIYYQSQKNKFEQVRSKIVNNYRTLGAEDNMIRNILYLMDYTSLVEMGANAFMSKQDYLHFLILLVGFPDLVPSTALKTQLTKHLISFIIELINSKRNQYIYYIKLLPQDLQAEQTSSIIISVDALQTFDWKALEQLLEEEKYKKIVRATIDKYRLKTGVELEAAIKLVQLSKDEKRAYDCLLTLFINHYLHKTKYPREVVIKAEQTGLDWTAEDDIMQIQVGFGQRNTGYRMLFNFIAAMNRLNYYIIARNSQMLREFISSCEFVILKLEQPNSHHEQLLQILDNNNGLELYFLFLRLVVKGAEIYSVRIGDSQKLKVLKSALLEQVGRIKKCQWRRKSYEQSQLIKLEEELTNSIVYLGQL